MADIIYTYRNRAYGNLTNRCDCACTFCIRNQQDGIGNADNLWHEKEPTQEEVLSAIDSFDFSGYEEFVFCGYGEPTCALENLIAAAKRIKEKSGLPIRLNTNGLGNLFHKRDIVPELAKVIDIVSVSLNAPTAEKYNQISRPQFPNAFPALLDFAEECQKAGMKTQLSVVDVLPADEIAECQALADARNLHLRVRIFGQ